MESSISVIRVSSSIANFRDKLVKRYPEEWSLRHIWKPCVFFGMYHIGDYVRFRLHRGKKKIFWCGSDIGNLWLHNKWQLDAEHVCENQIEQVSLRKFGIEAEVRPMIFDSDYPKDVSFKPSTEPHVYITAHEEASDYGVWEVEEIHKAVPEVTFHIYGVDGTSHDNVVYHGEVSNDDFNDSIRNYHGAIRFNHFDGFSETVAKSILMGQYPMTRIPYEHIDSFSTHSDLIALLKELKNKTVPNVEARNYWLDKLTQPL